MVLIVFQEIVSPWGYFKMTMANWLICPFVSPKAGMGWGANVGNAKCLKMGPFPSPPKKKQSKHKRPEVSIQPAINRLIPELLSQRSLSAL